MTRTPHADSRRDDLDAALLTLAPLSGDEIALVERLFAQGLTPAQIIRAISKGREESPMTPPEKEEESDQGDEPDPQPVKRPRNRM